MNTYEAGIIELTKRLSHGWGGRFSYTYSVLKDNQIGETNFYSAVGRHSPMNNYNYNPSAPACAAGQQFTTACYDPRAEWGYGILDVPHRIIIAPMFELPFGKGKKYASDSGVADAIVGGWTIAFDHHLAGGLPVERDPEQPEQRCSAATPARGRTSPRASIWRPPGSYEDRLASADHPAATWINPAAFSLAPFGRFGNSPRTITDLRTPTQFNTDVNFQKNVRLGGNKSALLKLEVLNLFDRPTVRALQGATAPSPPGNSFGQTTLQSGFMRIMQFMVRFSF